MVLLSAPAGPSMATATRRCVELAKNQNNKARGTSVKVLELATGWSKLEGRLDAETPGRGGRRRVLGGMAPGYLWVLVGSGTQDVEAYPTPAPLIHNSAFPQRLGVSASGTRPQTLSPPTP